MYKCPVCGSERFIVTAHVVQEWIVDKCGFCEDVTDDCICVTHEPSDDDIWSCYECKTDGPGSMFKVNDDN